MYTCFSHSICAAVEFRVSKTYVIFSIIKIKSTRAFKLSMQHVRERDCKMVHGSVCLGVKLNSCKRIQIYKVQVGDISYLFISRVLCVFVVW